jgi:carboxyl-terminal processing protease
VEVNKTWQRWQRLTLFSLVALMVAGGAFLRPLAAADESAAQQKLYKHFVDAVALVRENYVEPTEYDVLVKSGIQGMLRTLDPHSNYYDKKSFDEMRSEQRSQYYGIGSQIGQRDGKVFIQEPFEGTPAARAGLRYGDQIVAIDGKNTENWNSDQVRNSLRGEQGTTVKVSVRRVGVPEPVTVTIEREAIGLPSISSHYIVRPGIGYVNMQTRGFHSTTSDELTAAIASLKEQGANALVLDLRDNPGGFLDQAIKVSDKFLQRGQVVLSIRGREGRYPERELPAESGSPESFPVVILINKSTASASEIVAGAIQDHDRGLIVGETSFGKGLVQTIIQLQGGAGLTLTTARYYTPSGRLIQRDYSNGSAYEYIFRRASGETVDPAKPRGGKQWYTDLRRPVYGGGGIEPDVKVADTRIDSLDLTPTQLRLLSPLFLFVRELAGGQVAAAKHFKLDGIKFDHQLKGDEYLINDEILKAYRAFMADFVPKHPEYGLTMAMVDDQMVWARNRIRHEMLLAAYGADVAQRAMNGIDAQLQKAVAELPNAAALAEKARRSRNVSSK